MYSGWATVDALLEFCVDDGDQEVLAKIRELLKMSKGVLNPQYPFFLVISEKFILPEGK